LVNRIASSVNIFAGAFTFETMFVLSRHCPLSDTTIVAAVNHWHLLGCRSSALRWRAFQRPKLLR
jgi:hypothetical protein